MNKKWIVGVVLAILGFQLILFAHRTVMLALANNVDHPDTVYVFDKDSIKSIMNENHIDSVTSVRIQSNHTPVTKQALSKSKPRRYETFRFNPNTATQEEFERLGFTEKQAQSIINYRKKGGKFKKKVQFQASYVVSDSIYQRLKDYIYLPKVDINKADTFDLQFLPGIGKGRANSIVQLRNRLQGFSYPEQIMEVYSIDEDVYNELKDRIYLSQANPYPLWELPEDSLFLHPYIRYAASSIIKFKKKHKREDWTIDNLERAEVLKEYAAYKLRKCNIKPVQVN